MTYCALLLGKISVNLCMTKWHVIQLCWYTLDPNNMFVREVTIYLVPVLKDSESAMNLKGVGF